MQFIYPLDTVYVAKSSIPHAGRGVFAKNNIKKDQIIEIAPVLVLPKTDYEHVRQTLLFNYFFYWNKTKDIVAVGLGYSSLYNHSYDSVNATYVKDFAEQTLTYKAIKDIRKDQEILVNYNSGNPEDTSSLWITDIPRQK